MHILPLHEWPVDTRTAIALQKELASRVELRALHAPVSTVAGADATYLTGERRGIAAVVVVQLPGLDILETAVSEGTITFPYVPGLLSFREAPLLLQAFQKLHHTPDLAIFDGQGIAHPRGLGLASHMGLWLQIPTIGCAKKKLTGRVDPPENVRGAFSPMFDNCHLIGAAVRTRAGVKPVYVSPGHLISISESIRLVLECTGRYRLPEPLRLAHQLVSAERKKRQSE